MKSSEKVLKEWAEDAIHFDGGFKDRPTVFTRIGFTFLVKAIIDNVGSYVIRGGINATDQRTVRKTDGDIRTAGDILEWSRVEWIHIVGIQKQHVLWYAQFESLKEVSDFADQYVIDQRKKEESKS